MLKLLRRSWIVFVAMVLLSIGIQPAQAGESEAFYREVSALVHDRWQNGYVGKVVFQLNKSQMLVDGLTKEIEQGKNTAPILAGNTVMIPLRALVEQTGGDIRFEEADGKVIIRDFGALIELHAGSKAIQVNGETVMLDTAPIQENGRTMIPLRAISQGMGYHVDWDSHKERATLTRNFQTMRLIIKVSTVGQNEMDWKSMGAVQVIEGPDGLYVLQFDNMPAAQACYERLLNSSQVELVAPDNYLPPLVEAAPQPKVLNGNSNQSWGVAKTGLDWLAAKKQTGQIVVAVLDTGVDANHPLLFGRILPSGYDFVNNDNNPADDQYHGTHVAGIIADSTGGKAVNILPVKVMDQQGSGTTLTVAAGIQYAVDHGADIINLSLAGSSTGQNHYLDSIVEAAIAKKIVVIAAAGNDGDDVQRYCPAHNRDVIVVSAVNDQDERADFSNYGDTVDLAAPGVAISSAVPGGGYAELSGTSMAAPHVAAAVALLKLQNPTQSPQAVEALLKSNTTDKGAPGWDPYYGSGVLALSPGAKAAIPPQKTEAVVVEETDRKNEVTAEDSVLYGQDGQPVKVTLRADEILENGQFLLRITAVANARLSKMTLQIAGEDTVIALQKSTSTIWSCTMAKPASGTSQAVLTIYDIAGNTATAEVILQI